MPRTARDPRQLIKEAHQIARDHGLRLSERPTTKGTEFVLYRVLPTGRPCWIGKRTTPAGIRTFVAKVANFH